jgi:2-oxoglutarate ferredoxin oxidoreductase subunit alpha
VHRFLESHPRLFVVEQNRDAQLRAMLAIETGVARDRMTAVLDYGGLPLTARAVIEAISRGGAENAEKTFDPVILSAAKDAFSAPPRETTQGVSA